MTQFTCKGVKQINNRISIKYDIHLYHSYLSAFFVSTEFPEILIAKCRSKFYCTWFFSRAEDFESWRKGPSKSGENFFVGGRSCRRKRCAQEINVSRAGDPVHAGDKALTRETPVQRGRVNRYAWYSVFIRQFWSMSMNLMLKYFMTVISHLLQSLFSYKLNQVELFIRTNWENISC